ncbi:MAG TPA: sulfurtransferase [Candidatus Limnocylindrales bacterium]|jgi:thiosulfate/3-mercaptopyruvate sulfurtransferase|nr:sulfurtransferase [Candidatus Limnocylindrales bacterium]
MTRPSPLISADGLRALVDGDAPHLRIVDVRWYLGRPGDGVSAYAAGHLPNAIHLDLDDDLADLAGYGAPGRHPLPTPEEFAAELGGAGIGDDDLVVAYDDVGGWVAARLWWMLDVLGHDQVAVLDGGIEAWREAGGQITTIVPIWPPTDLHLADSWSRVIDRAQLRARLGEVVLLDARAVPRYRGEAEPVDPVAGHIPTARNAPVEGNLVNGRFRPAGELAARFRDLGADGTDGPVVTSCGSGTSALHHALAMRLAGLPDPTLYVGSYSDWSRSSEPVVTGPAPGEPPPPR